MVVHNDVLQSQRYHFKEMRSQLRDIVELFEWEMMPELRLLVLQYAGLVRVSRRGKLMQWTIFC